MQYDDYLPDDVLQAYCNSINSRARALSKTGIITVANLRHCILDSGGRCQWCDTSLIKREFEIDHIISLVRGGSNTVDNLAVACAACNRRKSSKHTAKFVREIYAQTGKLTALIERVIAYYKIDDLSVQQSLFDNPSQQPKTIEPEANDEPPPYIWGN